MQEVGGGPLDVVGAGAYRSGRIGHWGQRRSGTDGGKQMAG